MKKNLFLLIIIIFSVVFNVVSCNDPIFYLVHEEVPVLKPLIDGSPTNFVTLNNKLYVASGKQIWEYDGNSWSKWKKLDDRVVRLAATNATLYALCLRNDNGADGIIRDCSNNVDLGLSSVISIYVANNVLFACAGTKSYTVYHYSSSFIDISSTTSNNELKGVAYDSSGSVYYYLCTSKGIICVDSSFNYNSTLEKDIEFNSIINLNTTKAEAITVNGAIYEISNATATNKNVNSSSAFNDKKRYTTNALAIWKNPDTTQPNLLLVGRRESYYSTSTGYTYGYVEIGLDSSSGITGTEYKNPGEGSPTSVDNNERYVSSLGKKPVNHIIQFPDSNGTLFASTQQNGVWSYRIRDGEWQWNAEQ